MWGILLKYFTTFPNLSKSSVVGNFTLVVRKATAVSRPSLVRFARKDDFVVEVWYACASDSLMGWEFSRILNQFWLAGVAASPFCLGSQSSRNLLLLFYWNQGSFLGSRVPFLLLSSSHRTSYINPSVRHWQRLHWCVNFLGRLRAK